MVHLVGDEYILSRLKLISRHEQFPSFHNGGCLESSGPLLISGTVLMLRCYYNCEVQQLFVVEAETFQLVMQDKFFLEHNTYEKHFLTRYVFNINRII